MINLNYLKYIEKVVDSHIQSNAYLSTLKKEELNFPFNAVNYKFNATIPLDPNLDYRHLNVTPDRDTLLFTLIISKGVGKIMKMCFFKVKLNSDSTVNVFDTSYEVDDSTILTEEISLIKQQEFVDWVKGFKMFQCIE